MAKYLHAAGITKPYSPHALRQSLRHAPPQCRCPVRGGQRAHGASVHQHDPALHAAL
jgi:hypothetical protein